MAAPPTTARTTPTGFKMPDGFRTTLASALKPAVQVWEQTVMPPGQDGGELIPTTTMHNITWRTKDTKALKELTECTVKGMMDPDAIADLGFLINRNSGWTIHFPDNSTLDFWGALRSYKHSEHEEGKPPEITLTIEPSNWDPANRVESGPVYTANTGT